MPDGWPCIDCKICSGNFITGPYWKAKSITPQLMVNQSKINPQQPNGLIYHSCVIDFAIQYGYIIEAAISYYPIRNGWKLWHGKNGLFYYKSIQDWQSYDLQNLGLKIHNFSLELKQSKTPPAASCWIISTLVRRYVFFNPRCCKSWDCSNMIPKKIKEAKTADEFKDRLKGWIWEDIH